MSLQQWLWDVVTWPQIVLEEARKEEYKPLLLGLYLTYTFSGVASTGLEDLTPGSYAVLYLTCGVFSVGSKELLTGSA